MFRNADSWNRVAPDGLICMLAYDCLWLCMDVTGHSLGGALATLAAFDIRKQLLDNRQSNTHVVCYTFAAPRTGNHAFARDYNAAVPDTWSVINDQVGPLPYPLASYYTGFGKTHLLGLSYCFGVKRGRPLGV